MKKSFHENVTDSFAEYFMQDLVTNLETLIDMVKALEDSSLSKSVRRKIVIRMRDLKEFINEEIEMIEKLRDERLLTSEEIKLFKQIKKLRGSTYIKKLEALTR